MINENLTELPEYWYCELTDESRDTLNNWRKNIIKYSDANCPDKWIRNDGRGGRQGGGVNAWREITFSQFKKWVLKEEPIAEKLPTVVELVAGEIYNFSWNGGNNYTFKKGVAKAIDKDSYYSYFIEPNYEQYKDSIRPATPEEKQWLNACIKAYKFIPKEEVFPFVKGKYYRYGESDSIRYIQFDYINERFDKLYYLYRRDIKNQTVIYNDYISYTKGEFTFVEVTEQEAKGIKVKKEVDKWTNGGWVRLLVDYGHNEQHKKGTIAQIIKAEIYIHLNLPYYINGESEKCKLTRNTECEWIGMEKPLEVPDKMREYPMTPDACFQAEEWIPKVGDWVTFYNEKKFSQIDGTWIDNQGITNYYYNNRKNCSLKEHLIKALPHEIPNNREKLYYDAVDRVLIEEMLLFNANYDSTNQLKIKADVTRIDTSLPKINSISINLKTKTKTIKF